MAKTRKLQLPDRPKESFNTPTSAADLGFKTPGPIPVGQVMRPTVLLDSERVTLESLGYKDGDAIPTDMAKRIGAFTETTLPQVDMDLPPLAQPKSVSIADLPEAQRELLMQDIQKAVSKTQVSDGPQLTPVDQLVDVKDDVTNRKNPAPRARVIQDGVGLDVSIAPSFCPHCNWDMSVTDIPDPGEEDRLWYLQALLGGKQFEKTIELMGGGVKVTYRELTIPESDAIYAQVGKEMKANPESTLDMFLGLVKRYRLATQMTKLQLGNNPAIEIPDAPTSEQLPDLLNLVIEQAVTSVTLANILARALDQFNRMISKLEACVERENFWPAA